MCFLEKKENGLSSLDLKLEEQNSNILKAQRLA